MNEPSFDFEKAKARLKVSLNAIICQVTLVSPQFLEKWPSLVELRERRMPLANEYPDQQHVQEYLAALDQYSTEMLKEITEEITTGILNMLRSHSAADFMDVVYLGNEAKPD